ncbi:hypothetical protein BH20VER3_BH20VER3_00560 [soil metagenome]
MSCELNVVPVCPRCGSGECYALDELRVECFQCHEIFLHPVLIDSIAEEKAA